MVDPGFAVWDHDPALAAWAAAAHRQALTLDTSERRHGGTWFVGVDALDNAPDGAVDGTPWPHRDLAPRWHRAQVSIVYPGYPQQDAGESDAAHRFRVARCAAHVDGLLPEGPDKRRHLREPHAFILGVPLHQTAAAPLVVWPGSHLIMGRAFAAVYRDVPPLEWGDIDVTSAYQSARRAVFARCAPVAVPAAFGQAVFVHRHLLHGVAPWGDAPGDARMIAYFRPEVAQMQDWL